MSYDIDSCKIFSSHGFRVHRDKANAAIANVGDKRPGVCPFDDLTFGEDGYAKLTEWHFHGKGSGSAYCNGLLSVFAKATEGYADIGLTWEGGDSHSGVVIEDGKAQYVVCNTGLSAKMAAELMPRY